jgi:hypothetical protein
VFGISEASDPECEFGVTQSGSDNINMKGTTIMETDEVTILIDNQSAGGEIVSSASFVGSLGT